MEAIRRIAFERVRSLLIRAVLLVPGASAAAAQLPVNPQAAAGSELERYLRAVQLADGTPTPATRPSEMPYLPDSTKHPWAARLRAPSSKWWLVSPEARLIANTGFPYGFNDGPTWAGRGLTLVASGGISVRPRWLTLTLAPTVFLSQNASFGLRETVLSSQAPFADGYNPSNIDQPQRFGSSAYGRIDPGESEIRVTVGSLALGASSAAEIWGPATEHPVVLGNNAGGIPRVFVGTSRPVTLPGVTFDARMFWGRLDESGFGLDTGTSRRHFATGATAVLGFPAAGLELGGTRFIHSGWPVGGWRDLPWTRVFQEIIPGATAANDTTVSENSDNQLGSVFLRWAVRGFEAYIEYGRDDRNSELDDLIQEPDHDAGFTIGVGRTWKSEDGQRMTVLRGEIINTQISNLQQGRNQTPWYLHGGATSNGHTERGQVLGSAGGYGGGASALVVDRYSPSGRTTVRWDRIIQATPRDGDGIPQSSRADVMHAVGIERAHFAGRGELTLSVTLVAEFNRQFDGDAFNANLGVGYRLIR